MSKNFDHLSILYLSLALDGNFTTITSESSKNVGSAISFGSITKISPDEKIVSLIFIFPLIINVISVAIL